MTNTGLFDVTGKIALVTGGSRGIGLMMAEGLVHAGARVYISSRKSDVCDAAAKHLSESGTCFSIPGDIVSKEGIGKVAKVLEEREGQLHILVNNAGATWGAPLEQYPEAGWDKVMDTNVKSTFFLTHALLPLLRKAASQEDPARVINISSIEGTNVPVWENYAYPASKAAVLMLTKQLAFRLAVDHITVNAIAPGLFPSRMTTFLLDDDEVASEAVEKIPLRRLGGSQDAAGAAIFLSSRAGAYLTGSVVTVDGGASLT